MQESQQGLLQTLLYQVLRQFPALVPIMCPIRWNVRDAKSELWSFDELFNAFDHFSKQTLVSTKLCVFIDGLDEYEGNHIELIRVVKTLASASSVKLCVSSRPWNTFIRAFGGSSQQLKLEDLTKDDIKNYVRSKLQENEPFKDLEKQDPHCNEIASDIVKRSQGVFLWVYLVVDSLLKGLDEGDDARDLRKRLNLLPDDLEEYFRHILQAIDPSYRKQTFRIFKTAVQAMQPLPVLAYSFFEQEEENPNYALELLAAPYPAGVLDAIHKRMKKRLNARCKDLLEVNADPSGIGFFKYRVDFLHRTVRDFFINTDVFEDMMNRHLATSFDVHFSLYRIFLALAKTLEKEIFKADRSNLDLIFVLVDELMYNAWQFESGCFPQQDYSSQLSMEVELVDELDLVLTKHTECLNWKRAGAANNHAHKPVHWSNYRDSNLRYQYATILDSAIRFQMVLYVRQKLESNPKASHNKDGRPLLDLTLRPNMVTAIQSQHLDESPNISMVHLLLEKGADPNQIIYVDDPGEAKWQTPWHRFLLQCYTEAIPDIAHRSKMCELIQALIEGGADPNLSFTTNDHNVVTISHVLKRSLRERDALRLHQLLVEKRQTRWGIWKLQGIWSIWGRGARA
jgi:hypothetical protein